MIYDEKPDTITLSELMADPEYQNRNSDITTEDFRALLAEEITPEDIYRRRRMAKYEAERAIAVEKRMGKFKDIPTRSLLLKFKRERQVRFTGSDYNSVELDAMKAVLATREHIETGKAGGKAARRLAAQQSRGQGKSKNR